MIEDAEKANREFAQVVEEVMLKKAPIDLNEFSENIEPVQLYLAADGLAMLIKRNMSHYDCEKAILMKSGSVRFPTKGIIISEETVFQEMACVGEVSVDTAKEIFEKWVFPSLKKIKRLLRRLKVNDYEDHRIWTELCDSDPDEDLAKRWSEKGD